jgi:HlyD family secretion protein
MDRPLPDDAVRLNRLRGTARIVLPLVAVATVIAMLPGWMRPTLTRARIRTAIVTSGPIEAVVSASGTVVPEVERILSSPVDARLLRILKRPGTVVNRGEPVAELDLGDSRLALERIDGNLAITDNKQDQARLALEKSLADLDARIARKELELQMLDEKAASSQRLSEEGLVSQQSLREARLASKQAAIELAQLRQERDNAERATELQTQGLRLERAALTKEAAAARHTLDLATTRSDRDGVVTWIQTQEGALVRRGEVVARIADLSSFRIDAAVSDVHSGRISTGIVVNVMVNETSLAGTITEVPPAVENDVIRFTVTLQEPAHRVLRPNMRVDVHVVTDRKARALTVRQGPSISGAGGGEVFVIRGGRAFKTPVTFGLRGPDDIEVASGLQEGDEVVISDVRNYLHLNELEVR